MRHGFFCNVDRRMHRCAGENARGQHAHILGEDKRSIRLMRSCENQGAFSPEALDLFRNLVTHARSEADPDRRNVRCKFLLKVGHAVSLLVMLRHE